MKKCFLFLLMYTQVISSYSQDFWEQIPFPDSLDITCLAVNQQGDIFVGTGTSYITDGVFRSCDNGQSWNMILNNANTMVWTLSINEIGHILVSTGGFYPLRASFDNGNSWDTIPMPFSAGIGKIEFLDQDTILLGTALSNGAILLSSSDLGMNWDTLFMTENHTSEYISDIAIAPNGDIYISLGCFFPDMGGVYKSSDRGISWEFIGLLNYQVKEVEVNAQGDLFIGVYSDFIEGGGGIYALYHDNPQLVECLYGPFVNGLAINSVGEIYAGTSFPDGVMVSKDNGITFSLNNNGLPQGPKGEIYCDTQDYIYALTESSSNRLYRTIEPTVIGLNELLIKTKRTHILIYPNPVSEFLQGKIYDELSDGLYRYTISDVTGRQIMINQFLLRMNSFNLDISFLSPGYYFLNFNYNGLSYSAKILKG